MVDTRDDRRTGQAYLLFAVSLLLVVTLGSLAQLVSVLFGLAITEVVLILVPAILFVRRKGLPVVEALGWRAVDPGSTLISMLVGVSGWGVAVGLQRLTVPVLGEPPEIPGLEPETLPGLLVLFFTAALLPGICEETLFRGVIQGVLRRRGSRRAVLITALLFAGYHVNPWIFVPALFLGVVFGIVVVRTGSTVPAMLAHTANNAVAVSVAYVYRGREPSAAYPLMAILVAVFCIAFPLFLRHTAPIRHGRPLLALVPAGVRRPGLWIVGLACGGVALAFVALIGVLFLFVDVRTVSDDSLEPEARPGDRLVLFEGVFGSMDLEVGDLVAVRGPDETHLVRIVRIEGESVWFRQGQDERSLPRQQITGKVVHVIRATE